MAAKASRKQAEMLQLKLNQESVGAVWGAYFKRRAASDRGRVVVKSKRVKQGR